MSNITRTVLMDGKPVTVKKLDGPFIEIEGTVYQVINPYKERREKDAAAGVNKAS